jgi:hypothetical protein
MRRREFITLIGGAAAWPVAARAQQKMPRIGILLLTNEEIMGPYRQALRDLGYIEGKSIQFEVRSAQGQANRLPEVAAELVLTSRARIAPALAFTGPMTHTPIRLVSPLRWSGSGSTPGTSSPPITCLAGSLNRMRVRRSKGQAVGLSANKPSL